MFLDLLDLISLIAGEMYIRALCRRIYKEITVCSTG